MNTQETETEVREEEGVETTEEEEETTDEEGESESEGEQPKKELSIDYKAKYDALQAKIAGDAFKYRNVKRQPEEKADGSESEEDLDKPITQKQLNQLLAEQETKTERRLNEKQASTFAESLTTSPDEAKYAVELWKNITLPFDTLEEQMNFIVAGMNAERIFAQNGELKRSLASKQLARKNTAGTVKEGMTSEPKISADVKSVLKQQGFVYNSTKKAFEKKLANGKKLYQNEAGKKWVE